MTPKAIKTALKSLPSGSNALDSACNDAMERIERQNPDHRYLAKRTLMWITYAQRLPHVEEIQHALATELGKSDLDRDNVEDSGDIVSICAGLVIVDTDHHLRGPVLRLVHYKMQEYLRRTGVIHFPNAAETIASRCLTYLLFDIFSGSACRLSPDHYNVQKDRGESAAINLMRTRNPDEVTGFLYFGCKRCSNGENHCLQKPAAFLGLTEIVSQLLEDGAKANIEDWSGETPLLWAINRGHDGVVNQLVIRDDVNTSAYHGDSTPLHRAIDTHSHTIVKALLASKIIDVIFRAVDTTLPGDKGRTLLSQAVFSGDTNAIGLLLMRDDIDPNAKNKQGERR
ncbi:hypothetical protein OEA41_004771 [Lepraria neglecta]|uniref:GPI inositol-deacylase winged helix domain-containing protein n=1 Tax=Lepraria neglecta TaxID=209136 RepID=A0AAE0DG60_9LECA|nr:hypothetical protein OEA41_004771 [Lepraria neglecta]